MLHVFEYFNWWDALFQDVGEVTTMRGTKPMSCRFPGPWQREGKEARARFLAGILEHLQARFCRGVRKPSFWGRGREFPCPDDGALWVLCAQLQFLRTNSSGERELELFSLQPNQCREIHLDEFELLVCTCGLLVLCLKIQSINKSLRWKQEA